MVKKTFPAMSSTLCRVIPLCYYSRRGRMVNKILLLFGSRIKHFSGTNKNKNKNNNNNKKW